VTAVEHWKRKTFSRARTHTHTHRGLLSLPSAADSLSSVFSKLNHCVFFSLNRRHFLSLSFILSLIFFLSFHDSSLENPRRCRLHTTRGNLTQYPDGGRWHAWINNNMTEVVIFLTDEFPIFLHIKSLLSHERALICNGYMIVI